MGPPGMRHRGAGGPLPPAMDGVVSAIPQEGGAFSRSPIVGVGKRQFQEEFRDLLKKHGIEFDNGIFGDKTLQSLWDEGISITVFRR